MKGSQLEVQLANLRCFVAIRDEIAQNGGNRATITLQLTFMEINLQEIPRVVELALETGCDRVKGHHLWAHFDEITNQDLRRNKESIQRWNQVAAKCRDIVAKRPNPKTGALLKLENFYDLEENPQVTTNSVCPFLGQEAWINHEGRFDPCCAPDEQRKSLGYFGNVTDSGNSLSQIWTSKNYSDLVKTYYQKKLCQGCTMRKPAEVKKI